MEFHVAGKEIERVAAYTFADASTRELDALQVQNTELDSEMTRLHSDIDAVKRLRAEITSLDCNVEKTAASLTDTANTRDKAVERADNLSARLAASVRREDAYKWKLTTVKEDFVKTGVERANL